MSAAGKQHEYPNIPLLPGKVKLRASENADSQQQDQLSIGGIGDMLMLRASNFDSFSEMWFSIFLWMTVSYVAVHIIAALVSLLMLRRHPWMFGLSLPIIAMMVIGPGTIGTTTSAAIAWAFYQSGAEMPNWYSFVFGCLQTVFCIFVSYSRFLASL